MNNDKSTLQILKVLCDINMAEPKVNKPALKILRGISRLNDPYAEYRLMYVFTIHKYKETSVCDWLNQNSSKEEYRVIMLKYIKILIKATFSMGKYIAENRKVNIIIRYSPG
jgi:hypothetical protein